MEQQQTIQTNNPQTVQTNNSEAVPNQVIRPIAVIVEEPSSRGTRFRYECEGRYSNVIYGASSKNSFPTIRVLNYNGPLSIIVSCVAKDPPYQPHPHKLVYGNNLNKFGVCCFRLPNNQHDITFKNLSIQCVARRNVVKALAEREHLNVDPFKTGYAHKLQPEQIDLNCIRLCFQVILETNQRPIPLDPIVSQPIYDKRSVSDLEICWLSHDSASIAGGTEMCVLCEKVSRNDIEVRFFNEDNGWEATALLVEPRVFKQVAIVFRTPAYRTDECSPGDIREPVNVFIQLRRKSDGKTSTPKPFLLTPLATFGQQGCVNQNALKRKREKYSTDPCGEISRRLQAKVVANPNLMMAGESTSPTWSSSEDQPAAKVIKTEPWELPPRELAIREPQQLRCAAYAPINNFNANNSTSYNRQQQQQQQTAASSNIPSINNLNHNQPTAVPTLVANASSSINNLNANNVKFNQTATATAPAVNAGPINNLNANNAKYRTRQQQQQPTSCAQSTSTANLPTMNITTTKANIPEIPITAALAAMDNNQYCYNIQSDQQQQQQQACRQSQQKCNSTDTLGSDSWIKDLMETINEDLVTQDYKIACEPEPEHVMTLQSVQATNQQQQQQQQQHWIGGDAALNSTYNNDVLNMNGPPEINNYLNNFPQSSTSNVFDQSSSSHYNQINDPHNNHHHHHHRGNHHHHHHHREIVNGYSNMYTAPNNVYPTNHNH